MTVISGTPNSGLEPETRRKICKKKLFYYIFIINCIFCKIIELSQPTFLWYMFISFEFIYFLSLPLYQVIRNKLRIPCPSSSFLLAFSLDLLVTRALRWTLNIDLVRLKGTRYGNLVNSLTTCCSSMDNTVRDDSLSLLMVNFQCDWGVNRKPLASNQTRTICNEISFFILSFHNMK